MIREEKMKTDRNQRTWIPVIILILTGMLLIGGVSASEFGQWNLPTPFTLLAMPATGATSGEFGPWSPQTVDSGGKVGQYSSAALDALGNPAISYYDQTYGDLMYASWDGSKWNITTVDCSRSEPKNKWDRSHDRTKDSDYIRCFHGTEKVGKYSSLAFDSTGKPSISFYDESRHDLKYASWNGSTWVITTVDGSKDGKGRTWKNWDGDHNRIDDRSTQVGEFTSLAFDSNDKPRISYYDESKGDLKYAAWDGSRWVITTVDGSRDEYGQKRNNWDGDWGRYNDRSRRVGEYSSLALDDSDNPSISYYDETNKNLKYAVLEGSRWNITTVDGLKKGEGQNKNHWDGDYHRNYDRSNKVGKYSSLALDSNGKPRISYYDESNKDLKYAAWDGNRWVITTVDSTKRVGEYASLKLDAKGDPRISYYDASHKDLKFAAWNSATSKWGIETVDSSGKVGSFTSLVLNSQGRPGISYYDQSHKDLKYTIGTGQTLPPAPVANFVGTPASGNAPLTVTFTDLSTNTPTSWGWEFGDGSSVNASVQNPVHTYASAGTYTVKLIATNSAGSNTSTQTNCITVTSGVVTPVANFMVSPTSGNAPLTVTFTDRSTNTPTSWSWDFGDGSSVNASVQNPVQTYASAGTYTVKLIATNSAGSNTSTQTNCITVNPATETHTFTSITPTSGPINGGTPVTIVGTNFADGVGVTIGGAAATNVIKVDANHITAVTPPGTAGARDVVITNTNGQTVTATSAFTYVAPPTFTSITPNSGSTLGGTPVTIVGTNFVDGIDVTIGGAAATIVHVDANQITAVTPPGTAGARDVIITNNDGQTVTGTGAYTYVTPPTFTSITPTSGPISGGTAVTIVGTNFAAGVSVTIDGAAATIVSVDANQITAVTPTGTAGARDVIITNTNGQTVKGTGAYTYVAPPTITSINPATGVAGTQLSDVSITGENFVTDTTPSVWLAKTGEDNINATNVVVNSPTQITCAILLTPYKNTIPGQWDLVVKNTDGQSGSKVGAFNLTNPAPVVTSIEPSTGINGTTIQIVKVTGNNFGFGQNPYIWLAKTGQTNIDASSIQIYGTEQLSFTLIIPASAPAGTWDLLVKSRDGQVSANLGVFEITQKAGATPLTWDWSADGWDGWQTTTTCPNAGTCTIYGPVMVGDHGEYGSDVTSNTMGKTESTVWKTFTAPSDTTWTTLTFTGLLSSSDLLNGRKMTIKVDGVNVYDATAVQDPAINGQQFTITKTFTSRNAVIVKISGIQSPIKDTTSYRMHFNTLTLS
jgi:PKD repeat protein